MSNVELIEQSFIQSSSGYHAAITYKGKGYLSGAAHRFVANVSPHPAASAAHIIEGQWTGLSKFVKSSIRQYESNPIFTDATGEDDSASRHQIQVASISEQGSMESRRVWKDVADGIRSSDFDKAGVAKSKLENEQRAMRKVEQSEDRTFALANFKLVQDDDEYRKLAQLFAFQPTQEESYEFIPGSAPNRH
ncbi:Oxysterol-binding protein 4 [Cystobasidiomycetes sp. EMM_F5]